MNAFPVMPSSYVFILLHRDKLILEEYNGLSYIPTQTLLLTRRPMCRWQ